MTVSQCTLQRKRQGRHAKEIAFTLGGLEARPAGRGGRVSSCHAMIITRGVGVVGRSGSAFTGPGSGSKKAERLITDPLRLSVDSF
eukprot:5942533-Prymnesium_polylepis.1